MRRALGVLLLPLLVAPVAAQGPIDFSKIQPTRDSFVVLVQGTPRGFEVISVERSADGIRVLDETNLMPVMRQETTVRLTTTGELRSVKQSGLAQGKPMSIDVRYLNGRATGTASTPSQSGEIENRVISAEVPADGVDDNIVLPLLAGATWGPDTKFSLPVFASGQNKLHTVTLTVVASERVTVPLGTFDAYKVEMTGLTTPVTLHVSATAPHRVLKVAPVGAPLEFVAAK
jgi:hypothetical protein